MYNCILLFQEPPKQVQKTLENTRVKDETWVEPDDEEVLQDAMNDEYAEYFSGEKVPKILFTTCNRPKCHVSAMLCLAASIKGCLKVVQNTRGCICFSTPYFNCFYPRQFFAFCRFFEESK